MEDILLSKFNPRSELVVPEHIVKKPKFTAIDFHTHFGLRRGAYDLDKAVQDLEENGVSGFVNLDGFWGDKLDEVLDFTKKYSDRIVTFGGVDVTKFEEKDFSKYVSSTLKESYRKGIRGLKFFKSLGLVQKDSKGNYIRVDDSRLKPIWETAAQLNIPVLIHIADPVAFFRPLDGNNERFEELNNHPDWSFYKEGLFTYEQLMEMQENLLESNPDTTFVITHVGSASENLSFVSKQMDKFPNMYVDMAARLAEMGRQPYTSRDFIIKYQDRFMFSTDISPFRGLECPCYWRFFETRDEYFDYTPDGNQGRWKIYGVDLPDEVLKKIYHENAIKLVPDFAKVLK